MSHTIIVGIDGSANSDCALNWAITHAQQTDSAIRLVAAYSVPGVTATAGEAIDPSRFSESIQAAAEELTQSRRNKVAEAGVEVSTVVTAGDASGVMVENSGQAELAVIGARGRGGFAGRLLGTVALAMPAHSHCPTVVIPASWPERHRPEKPLPTEQPVRTSAAVDATGASVASSADASADPSAGDADRRAPDFSGQIVAAINPFETDTPVLRDAAQQAKFSAVPLHLVGVAATHILSPEWLPSEAHLQKLYDSAATEFTRAAARLKAEFPEVDVRWSIFDAPDTEVLVSATYTADLIVIGSRGRAGFIATLLGSTSQGVLSHAVCPTRVIHVPKH